MLGAWCPRQAACFLELLPTNHKPPLTGCLQLGPSLSALLHCSVLRRFGRHNFQTATEHWWLAGAVNGVQSSLQSLFGSLTYAAGLVVWRPEDFSWLMLGSTGRVATAAAICTMFVLRHSLDAQKEVLPTAEA